MKANRQKVEQFVNLFVAVPMVAWALALITIPIAVLAGRRSSGTTDR